MTITGGGGGFDFRDIILVRTRWRQQLARDYEREAKRLVEAYGRVQNRLADRKALLIERVNQLAADDALTARRLRETVEFQRLTAGVKAELDDFAVILREQSATLQNGAVEAGNRASLQMVQASSGRLSNIVTSRWLTPDPEMLKALINYVDSPAMLAKFEAFGANAAQQLADAMLTLTAQGKGARSIASMLSAWDGVPRAWAENMARTVQQYSYRRATAANYRANEDVVEGWVWISSLDDRLCPACAAMHGTKHSNDELLNGHHSCRCSMAPLVVGTTWHETYETGEQWFARQPEAVQRGIMGKGRLEAYNAGKFDFSQLTTTYNDDVYGEMRRAATLKELTGGK